jgi:hypothetical protein
MFLVALGEVFSHWVSLALIVNTGVTVYFAIMTC